MKKQVLKKNKMAMMGGGVARKTLLKASSKKLINKNKGKITGGRGRISMNSGDIDPKAHKIYASSKGGKKKKGGGHGRRGGGMMGGVKKALTLGKKAAGLPGKIANSKIAKTGGKILRTAGAAASVAKALG